MIVEPCSELTGIANVPGDKSVTHRALLMGALARGSTEILHPGSGGDNLATLGALRALGVEATFDDAEHMTVKGVGLGGLVRPSAPIDCRNSGTTTRLLAGMLAGAGLQATLTGDDSLSRRPMRRVADPLRDLGYDVTVSDAGTLPLVIGPASTRSPDDPAVRAVLRSASAQVKSCILLSGLWRNEPTEVVEPAVSRDHTERMMRAFGLRVESSPHYLNPMAHAADALAPTVRLTPGVRLGWRRIEVPGDISSALFLLAAAALVGSGVTVRRVGINPTRTAALDVMRRMGARVQLSNRVTLSSGEPAADLSVSPAALTATRIAGAEIPLLIDEIPVLCVLGAASTGRFEVHDAAELRVKESDRIETTAALLRALGVSPEVRPDGLSFDGLGATAWPGFEVESHGDHRIALSAAVAALAASSASKIHGAEAIGVSYPQFVDTIVALGARVVDAPEPNPDGGVEQ